MGRENKIFVFHCIFVETKRLRKCHKVDNFLKFIRNWVEKKLRSKKKTLFNDIDNNNRIKTLLQLSTVVVITQSVIESQKVQILLISSKVN